MARTDRPGAMHYANGRSPCASEQQLENECIRNGNLRQGSAASLIHQTAATQVNQTSQLQKEASPHVAVRSSSGSSSAARLVAWEAVSLETTISMPARQRDELREGVTGKVLLSHWVGTVHGELRRLVTGESRRCHTPARAPGMSNYLWRLRRQHRRGPGGTHP